MSTTSILILQVSCSNKSECSDLSCFPHNSQHCLICDSQEIYAKTTYHLICCKKLHMKMMVMTGALMRRMLTPFLQRSLLMNALTENFYISMPPTRIHQPVCLRNPPTSFMLKDISTYVQDDADKGAIALQAYCPR